MILLNVFPPHLCLYFKGLGYLIPPSVSALVLSVSLVYFHSQSLGCTCHPISLLLWFLWVSLRYLFSLSCSCLLCCLWFLKSLNSLMKCTTLKFCVLVFSLANISTVLLGLGEKILASFFSVGTFEMSLGTQTSKFATTGQGRREDGQASCAQRLEMAQVKSVEQKALRWCSGWISWSMRWCSGWISQSSLSYGSRSR